MTTVIKCFLKHTSITWVYFSIAEGSRHLYNLPITFLPL
uniref:Uncharacterized protein n=1 Tax=Anguilla anguilla TaxID=7936 RepID=A0A0E9QI02_ANGAN